MGCFPTHWGIAPLRFKTRVDLVSPWGTHEYGVYEELLVKIYALGHDNNDKFWNVMENHINNTSMPIEGNGLL